MLVTLWGIYENAMVCIIIQEYLFFSFLQMCLFWHVKPRYFLSKALPEISKYLSLEKTSFQVTHLYKSLLN